MKKIAVFRYGVNMNYIIICEHCFLPFQKHAVDIIPVFKPVKCPMKNYESICYNERTCDFCPVEREIIFNKAMCTNCGNWTIVS